jgi:hypothetical protein|tara:strand:- start:989 stop:1924 length:936 start_codon:yes stop_codon:yes gene_type:complete
VSISKINGVATDDVVKVDGVAVADIAKVDGIEWPAAAAYLLDTYTDATLAYSFRQLKTGVTNCIDVVNSSNVTATIGFSGGYLDMAALDAHCGVGNGTISRWYDQSGNNRHANQSTSTKRPTIYSSGARVVVNSKMAASFDGNDRLVISAAQVHTGSFYANCTIRTGSTVANSSILNQDDSYTPTRVRIAQYLRTAASGTTARVVVFNTAQQNFADNSPALTTNTQIQISAYATATGTIEAFDNGTTNGSSSYTGTLKTGSHELAIGSNVHGATPAAFFTGHIQEVILFDGDQPSNRSSIESDVDTYYNIP